MCHSSFFHNIKFSVIKPAPLATAGRDRILSMEVIVFPGAGALPFMAHIWYIPHLLTDKNNVRTPSHHRLIILQEVCALMQSYFHHPAFNQNFDDGMYSKAKFYHDITVTSSGSKGLTHKYCNSSANPGPIYNWSQSFLYSMNGNFFVCVFGL